LNVVNDVCAAVGVHQTTSVVANINANRTMFEMLALANEMAARIAGDMRDWTMLRKQTTFTGNGVLVGNVMAGTEAFPLPADYSRMLTNSHVWRSTSTLQPMRFVPNTDEWLQRRSANWADAWGEWTIFGGQMHIWPIMGVGATARFSYLDKNPIALASSGFGDRFVADGDTYRLPERILKLGMLWQWKANKGSPYAEDMGTWGDAMALAMGTDSPAPILIDRLPISAHARTAYPWQVPTP
jgi:hypothetical protein